MKNLLALVLTLAVSLFAFAAESIPQTGFYVDLYGNVFKDGQNTTQQIGDYLVNHPTDAPALDGAWRDAALRARDKIAADTKTAQDAAAVQVAAKETEKQQAITAAQIAVADSLAAKDSQIATLQTEKATLQQEKAALQVQVQQLQAEKAALQTQLTAAQPPPPAP